MKQPPTITRSVLLCLAAHCDGCSLAGDLAALAAGLFVFQEVQDSG